MILAYSIGYAANSLPIPGGIGVLDAGLTGALVLYGISPVHAAAAVIVYHAIAFWVPGLGGLIAYLRLRPRLLGAGAHTPADPQPPPETHAFEEARYARTHIDAQTDPSSVSLTWRADPADASVLAQDGKSECRFRALGAPGWTADHRGASEAGLANAAAPGATATGEGAVERDRWWSSRAKQLGHTAVDERISVVHPARRPSFPVVVRDR